MVHCESRENGPHLLLKGRDIRMEGGCKALRSQWVRLHPVGISCLYPVAESASAPR